MAILQTQRYCRVCDRRTLHARSTFSNGWGCFLTIITLGLFLPVWLVIGILEAFVTRWRCQQCGQGRIT